MGVLEFESLDRLVLDRGFYFSFEVSVDGGLFAEFHGVVTGKLIDDSIHPLGIALYLFFDVVYVFLNVFE